MDQDDAIQALQRQIPVAVVKPHRMQLVPQLRQHLIRGHFPGLHLVFQMVAEVERHIDNGFQLVDAIAQHPVMQAGCIADNDGDEADDEHTHQHGQLAAQAQTAKNIHDDPWSHTRGHQGTRKFLTVGEIHRPQHNSFHLLKVNFI